MRTFVIGDIHGAYKTLRQCLELSKFNKNNDLLICLGDVCDRGRQVKECIDELLSIPKCIYILGNHDAWTLEWAIHGNLLKDWMDQGGAETVMSYKGNGMPKEHIRFLAKAPLWYVDKNRLFVHGGYDSERTVEETPDEIFLWDRILLKKAKQLDCSCPEWKFGDYDEIFVGHTPTLSFSENKPQKFCNVWAMDTGAGCKGSLTIMDVDTKEFWQSDLV